jgi:hypothetical protein
VTITLNVQVEILPAASVAVIVTGVEPGTNEDPEAIDVLTLAVQLSVAVALKFTTALQEPGSVFTCMSAGQFITGLSLSATVTSNEHVDTLPDASVAVLVTVVVPIANVDPDGGTDTTVAEQLSVAVTE